MEMFINLDDYVMIENKVKQGTVLENIHGEQPDIKNGDRIAIHENEECTHPFTYTVVYDRYNSCYSLMDPTWEIVLKTYDSINGLSRDQLKQYSKCLFGDDAIIKIEPVQWVSNS